MSKSAELLDCSFAPYFRYRVGLTGSLYGGIYGIGRAPGIAAAKLIDIFDSSREIGAPASPGVTMPRSTSAWT